MLSKFTNRSIVKMINGLNNFKKSNQRRPVRLMYAINQNLNKLEEAIKPFETSRNEIVDKYCQVEESGKIIPLEGNKETVEKQLGELLEIEIEVDVSKIAFDVIKDMEMLGTEFDTIEFMIEGSTL